MSFSLARELGAKVHYHTGVFTTAKSIVLGGAALVGVTAVALGVLAYLHLIGIPATAMYALGGTGGGLLLLTSGGALYLFIQHRRELNPLLQYEASQAGREEEWEPLKSDLLKVETDGNKAYYMFDDENLDDLDSEDEFNVIFMRDGNAFSIHLFTESQEAASEKMASRLNREGFRRRGITSERVLYENRYQTPTTSQ